MQSDEIQVPFTRVRSGARVPEAMTDGAAGYDLAAAEDVTLEPGKPALVATGIAVAIPSGYEGQVRPRSGLALRHAIGMLNAPGTIDSDYRGEIGVILMNFSREPIRLAEGERVAQIVFQQIARPRFVERDALPDSNRGAGGFGHTGR